MLCHVPVCTHAVGQSSGIITCTVCVVIRYALSPVPAPKASSARGVCKTVHDCVVYRTIHCSRLRYQKVISAGLAAILPSTRLSSCPGSLGPQSLGRWSPSWYNRALHRLSAVVVEPAPSADSQWQQTVPRAPELAQQQRFSTATACSPPGRRRSAHTQSSWSSAAVPPQVKLPPVPCCSRA